jgi:hypothetical protein
MRSDTLKKELEFLGINEHKKRGKKIKKKEKSKKIIV